MASQTTGRPGPKRKRRETGGAHGLRCPAALSPSAKRAWRELVKAMDGAGVLSAVDGHLLEVVAGDLALMREARSALKEQGLFAADKAHSLELRRSPAALAYRLFRQDVVDGLGKLFMTPSARARANVVLESAGEVMSPWLVGVDDGLVDEW